MTCIDNNIAKVLGMILSKVDGSFSFELNLANVTLKFLCGGVAELNCKVMPFVFWPLLNQADACKK